MNNATEKSIGVLVCNLGSPAAPTAAAVRRYLAEFLADQRVVTLSPWLWLPVLYGVVLPIRAPRSAANYAKIWTSEGSPLLAWTRKQAEGLQILLNERFPARPIRLVYGMRYGQPSIAQALESLRQAGVEKLLVLPLYPQYAGATGASVFDAVAQAMSVWPRVPDLRLVTNYHDDMGYIASLAASVHEHWQAQGRGERLLMSFHGLPVSQIDKGDPYAQQCQTTAKLLAQALALKEDEYQVVFQSRFGAQRWLQPYAEATLQALGKQGCRRLDVVCPGFSADCLETLEEITLRGREVFEAAGGGELRYIPALNDRPDHLAALADLIQRQVAGW